MRPPDFLPLLLATLIALTFAACGGDEEEGRGRAARAFPVEVETLQGRTVEYVVTANGTVEAFEEVQVTARVSGVVEKIHFREGDLVDRETVLIEIEPRRFQYELDVARAAKARAEAELKEAQDGLRRRENPSGEGTSGIFSKEEIEAWRTRVAVAKANVDLRTAEFQQAELDLENARPTPPMAGRIQQRLISTGQWVSEGTTITSLIQRDPMLVRFSIPADQATSVVRGQKATFRVGGQGRDHVATVAHVAATADPTTRMKRVTAEVSEEDSGLLTPGAYARVKVIVDQRTDAVTVPETAVRPSEKGYLVYVVENGKGESKVIETGMRTPDGRIEVTQGLELGDVVVVRGADALRPGVQVTIVEGAGGRTPEAAP